VELLDSMIQRRGVMVPNQCWTQGALAPMAIMGKYYMCYGHAFAQPRALGRMCAERFEKELIVDTAGFCRFPRGWAEDTLPDIFGSLYGMKDQLIAATAVTASRINSRNASMCWESDTDIDFVHTSSRGCATWKGKRTRGF
jgi:glyceraldehyde-3-phosphate dehydrogenase (ferredoxin)